MVAALVGMIVGLASLATLDAIRGARGERSVGTVDVDGRGGSPGGAGERSGEGGPASGPQPPATGGASTPLVAFRVYEDERTGYRFSYPDGWEVSFSGGVTRLGDATGDVIIAFRTAPSGSIHDFSARLVGILASRYGPVDLVVRDDAETSRGEPSLVLGGKATSPDGSPINFMIVAIEGIDRNRAVTVRYSTDLDLIDVSSWLRRIAGSFTTSPVTTA